MHPNSDTVRRFYDEFSISRMLNYRLRKNRRIEKAIARILPLVADNSQILDLGCGIGLVTERMALKAKDGFVRACDISEQNIWYAQQTVKAANVEFRRLDVLVEFQELQKWISAPLDLVVLVDVLEHLPPQDHQPLFSNLRQILCDNGTMVLTYPSPQYQRHLRAENPAELQVIDEIIELEYLLTLAKNTGFGLRLFSLENMWLENQYVHCILQTSTELRPLTEATPNLMERIFRRLFRRPLTVIENRILLPFRRHRYVTRVFKNSGKTAQR